MKVASHWFEKVKKNCEIGQVKRKIVSIMIKVSSIVLPVIYFESNGNI